MPTKTQDGVTRALINLYRMSAATHVFVAALSALFTLYARFGEHSTFLAILGLAITLAFVMFAGASLFREQRMQRQLVSLTARPLDDIAYLDEATIEKLVCTSFTLRGLTRAQPPRGCSQSNDIDLFFSARKHRVAVSTRCWLDKRIDAHYVKRFNSAATACKATDVCVLTCGEFSSEAFDFGQRRGITLVAGRDLVAFLSGTDANIDIQPEGEKVLAAQSDERLAAIPQAGPEQRTVPMLFVAGTIAEQSPDAVLNIALSTGAGVVVFGNDAPGAPVDKWPMLAGVLISELRQAVEPYFAIQKYLENERLRHPVRWRAIDDSARAWPECADELEVADAGRISQTLVERLQRALSTT